jgi:hypothetical protein
VHVIVMSKLDRQYRIWRVGSTMPSAIKRIAYEDILSDQPALVVYLRERMKADRKMGRSWKYGIKANRSTIDATSSTTRSRMTRETADNGSLLKDAGY